MAEPKRRIIVDGLDFPQLFQFPKLFRAVPIALQPPRLVVALFMVLLLVTAGRVWDAVTSPRVHPQGLLAGLATDEHHTAAQSTYRRAMQDLAPQDRRPEGAARDWPQLDPARILRDIRAGYRDRREAEREAGADAEQLRRLDQRYANWVNEIHRVRPRGAFEATGHHLTESVNRLVHGVIVLSPLEVAGAFADVFILAPLALWRDHIFFLIVYGLFFVVVGSIGGGAICRMAATEVAGHERVRARDALQFSMTNWPRFVLAPLLPLVIVVVVALLIMLLGLLTNVPVLDVIAGVLYAVALLLGFLVALLLIGYVAALPMFIPAIACENCDAADAQQRAYAYVLSRPLHLLGYAIIAAIVLALGFLLVSIFAWAMLNLTAGLFGAWTTSPATGAAGGYFMLDLFDRPPPVVAGGATTQATAWLIGLWETLVLSLVAAFILGLLFALATIIYLLMRRASDGQAIEEIWRPGLAPGSLARLPEVRAEAEKEKKKEERESSDESEKPTKKRSGKRT